jgi:hypothetical protein
VRAVGIGIRGKFDRDSALATHHSFSVFLFKRFCTIMGRL